MASVVEAVVCVWVEVVVGGTLPLGGHQELSAPSAGTSLSSSPSSGTSLAGSRQRIVFIKD